MDIVDSQVHLWAAESPTRPWPPGRAPEAQKPYQILKETLLFQIQEMLRIERIVRPEKVQEELDVYNELLPDDGEVAATLFIEVTGIAPLGTLERLSNKKKLDAKQAQLMQEAAGPMAGMMGGRMQTAARLLRQHGYDGIGVADIMKAAGLTHGGFYSHFKSKDELVEKALQAAGDQVAPGLSPVAESAPCAPPRRAHRCRRAPPRT